jgi:hypothetical protein
VNRWTPHRTLASLRFLLVIFCGNVEWWTFENIFKAPNRSKQIQFSWGRSRVNISKHPHWDRDLFFGRGSGSVLDDLGLKTGGLPKIPWGFPVRCPVAFWKTRTSRRTSTYPLVSVILQESRSHYLMISKSNLAIWFVDF